MKVFFISSEVVPFAKTGGLADFSSALPKELKELDCDIRIIMPKYRIVDDRKYVLRDVIRLKGIPIMIGKQIRKVSIKSAFIPNTKIQIYFIDDPEYFDRKELYIDPKTGTDYKDNPERFILFARAALEMLKKLYWQPDIIHCNDWQTAIIPYILKSEHQNDTFFEKTATLITIHNFSYQGNFNADNSNLLTHSDGFEFEGSSFEHLGEFNLLKSGLDYANLLNTVSKSYAKEIQDKAELSNGLNRFLKEKRKRISGILNGIDTSVWNPNIDPFIYHHYSVRTINEKVKNKEKLMKQIKLPFKSKTPLIGMISRLVDQKGTDLLIEVFSDLMKLNLQFVILGKGEKKYQNFFKEQMRKYPTKIYYHSVSFAEELSHLIEAGSDMILMPSRFEPCGLNQMYSLAYGTVPIVRKTGGLADTIVNFTKQSGKGTGLVFDKFDSKELIDTVKRALILFEDKDIWYKIVKNGMRKDFSWNSSAKKYIKLYRSILK